jgi:DNA repair protein RadC
MTYPNDVRNVRVRIVRERSPVPTLRRYRRAPNVSVRFVRPATDGGPVVTRPDDSARLFVPILSCEPGELLCVMLLDRKNTVLGIERLYRGAVAETHVRVGEVFRSAILAGASAIILAHNHPSGSLEPSVDDHVITREVIAGGDLLGIEVLDHVIVGGTRWYSMRASGWPGPTM